MAQSNYNCKWDNTFQEKLYDEAIGRERHHLYGYYPPEEQFLRHADQMFKQFLQNLQQQESILAGINRRLDRMERRLFILNDDEPGSNAHESLKYAYEHYLMVESLLEGDNND